MSQSRYSLMSEAYLSMYEGKRGLWDNIHAKRKRGEKPAKPGDKDYPETLKVETYEVTNADKKGNTPAYQAFKSNKKKKDGTPMYKAAAHMKEANLEKARKNVGADTCWDGYKAKGTKMKGGKSVPNCVKEDYIDYLIDHRFATDEESAEAIYDHMSDKWRMMIEDRIEQLDEISKGLATKAYAERRTNEFEGDELHTKSDKTHKRIVNKFGKKAGEDADKAANKKIFGEEASDAMKDRRMMRGGVDGNTRYDRAPKPSRSSRQPKGGDSSFDAVVKQLKGQYGDKSIMASKRTIKK